MTKKKELLFVIYNLNAGGAEKALISMLQIFDYNKYSVDLLLFRKEGIFLNQVPKEVNILSEPKNYKFFDMPFSQVIRENIFKNWNNIFRRIQFYVARKRAANLAEAEQFGWNAVSRALKPLGKQYDAAIGFLEKSPCYFVMDKVLALKKFAWIHNHYEQIGLNAKFDCNYFGKFDNVITVSETCLKSLNNVFPHLSIKFKLIENISSKNIIHNRSNEVITERLQNNILSIGRLSPQKAFNRAITALKILKEKGIDIQWFVIGEGELRKNLERQIEEMNLVDSFHLLGLRENPYPYIKNALIYCQTSIFEGKSIAIAEAKILGKPIVVTNYPSAKDQIRHMENGIICDMTPEAIAKSLQQLIEDDFLKQKFSQNLQKEVLGNQKEIEKLYLLIG